MLVTILGDEENRIFSLVTMDLFPGIGKIINSVYSAADYCQENKSFRVIEKNKVT